MATWYLVATLILLPHDVAAVLPIAAAIFTASYLWIFVMIAYVRHVVARIVVEEKGRRLADLRGRIDALLARVPISRPRKNVSWTSCAKRATSWLKHP